MMEPLASQWHGFYGRTYPTPENLCGRVWPRLLLKGLIVLNNKSKKN
jgi:hypothetical protein